jgi:hypothetical protein
MLTVNQDLAWVGAIVFSVGWSVAGPQPSSPATATLPLPITSTMPAAAAAPLQATAPTSCPDPLTVIKALYDANDAAKFEASLDFFTEDATFASWAEGINGHHMKERHLIGKAQIRPALGDPGLRHTSAQPDGPIYHENKIKVSGDRVTFMLEPDRLRPNGKQYNPFHVEVVFVGCKIKSLTVIDLVTWL